MKRALGLSISLVGILLLFSCGGGRSIRPSPPPPPPPPPVETDLTGHAVDSYGNPLAFASVLVDGEEIGVLTDEQGNFVIPAQLLAGRNRANLRIGFRHRNMAIAETIVDASGENIDLQLGEPDENGGTINGVVYDKDTGEPIANALVIVFRVPGLTLLEMKGNGQKSEGGASDFAPPWVSFAETGEDGTFTFENVPPGTFNVFAFHSDYKMKLIEAEVEAGNTTQLMIDLEPKRSTPPPHVEGYFVKGYVRNAETGEPVAGAFVQSNSDSGWYYIMGGKEQAEEEGEGRVPGAPPSEDFGKEEPKPSIMPPPGMPPIPPDWEPPIYQETYTDENGYFEFEGPFNGAGVFISVTHESYMPFSQYYQRKDEDTLELDIELTPIIPVHVSGTVVNAENGQPIADAYVEFIYINYGYFEGGGGIVMPAGMKLEDADARELAESGYEAGSAPAGAPTPPNFSGGYSEPYDNYAMQKFRHEQRNRRGASQMDGYEPFGYYSAVTDENGNFDLGEIPSGTYSIFAQAWGYLSYWAEEQITEDIPDYTISLEEVPVGEIEGFVTDEEGNPVDDVLIDATQPNVDPFTFTDESGYYLLTNVPAGFWRVGAYKEGYQAAVVENVEVIADQRITVNLQITKISEPTPPNTIKFSGHMLDGATGESVGGVEMVAVKTDDTYFAHTFSAQDGYFEMNLVPGDYMLNAVKNGYVELFTWFWVDEDFPTMDFYLWPIGSWGGGQVPMRGGWIEEGTDVPPPPAPGAPPMM